MLGHDAMYLILSHAYGSIDELVERMQFCGQIKAAGDKIVRHHLGVGKGLGGADAAHLEVFHHIRMRHNAAWRLLQAVGLEEMQVL